MRHKIYSYVLLGVLFFLLIAAKEQCEIASLDLELLGVKKFPFSLSAEIEKFASVDKLEDFEFTLQNPQGDIIIEGKETQEIKIKARKTLYTSSAKDLGKLKEGIQIIEYEESENALDVRVPITEELAKVFGLKVDDFTFEVDFTISVPRTLKEISVNSANGKVTLEDIYSNLAVESVNGKIEAVIDGKETTLSITNGKIDAKIRGGETSLSAANTGVKAEIDSGKVFTSGMNGFVNLILNHPQGGEISFTNGYVTTNINHPQDLKIVASVANGRIDFTGLENLIKEDKGRKVIGIVGKPDKELKISATNANIKIRVKTHAVP